MAHSTQQLQKGFNRSPIHSTFTLKTHRPFCKLQAASAATVIGQRRDNRTGLLDLVQWALARGIKYSKIRPAEINGSRGLVATYPIAAGEALISVPRATALTTHPSEPTPLPQHIPQATWQQLPWYGKLAAKLLHESSLGAESQYATFVQLLPEAVDLPVLWGQEQLQQLQYPPLQQKVAAEQGEWARCHTLLQPFLAAKGLSQEDLHWALSCVSSRSFAGPYIATPLRSKLAAAAALQAVAVAVALLGHSTAGAAAVDVVGLAALAAAAVRDMRQAGEVQLHAMCPMIDMLNHSSTAAAGCEFDLLEDSFKVAAGAPAAAGQELFISYGAMGNDSLLQLYGFVEEGNVHDSYVLVRLLGLVEEVVGKLPQQFDQLQLLQQPVVITAAGFEDGAVMQALQQLLQLVGVQGMTAEQLLAAACMQERRAMGSSLEEDLELRDGLLALPGLQQQQQQLQQQLERVWQGMEELRAQQQQQQQQQQEEQQQQQQLEAELQQMEEVAGRVQMELDAVQQQLQGIAQLQQKHAGVPWLALQLRIGKKQLLHAFCQQHRVPQLVA